MIGGETVTSNEDVGPGRPMAHRPRRPAKPTPDTRPDLVDSIRKKIDRDLQLAAAAGVFGQSEGHHLSRTPLVLDEEGRRRTRKLLDSMLEQVGEIQREVAARLDASGDDDEASHTTLILAHLKSPSE